MRGLNKTRNVGKHPAQCLALYKGPSKRGSPPSFRSHDSQLSLRGTSAEATEHFPGGRSAKKDGQSQLKGGGQKGHPMATKREALDLCKRQGFKTHKASSLRPDPNRKFVTNLENMQAQLQEADTTQKR